MPYRVIAGEFHIRYPDQPRNGPEPDGDTLKFKPDNPDLVERLHRNGGRGPDFNSRGMVNVRLEGIDALETHFSGAHQELHGATDARDFVLDAVGFDDVVFFPDAPNKVQSASSDFIPGHILANGIDPHGRAIAFVYPGAPAVLDGSSIMLRSDLANQSVNARLLDVGLAYPAFYTTLPIDLKDGLAELSRASRTAGNGFWPRAQATPAQPAHLPGLDAASELVIWPKLFRRLVRYFGEGHRGLAAFDAWLRSDPVHRDDSILLPNRELGNMHDLFEIEPLADRLAMRFQPEDLIIVPDGVLPGQPPREVPEVSFAPVRIVAALVNPAGPDRDAVETVTLLNASPDPIDLAGWSLVDLARRRHNLEGDLSAGATKQIPLDTLQLNNDGDALSLVDVEDEVVDQVSYEAANAAQEGWTVVF